MYRSKILYRTSYVIVLSSLLSITHANDDQKKLTLTEAAEQFLEAAKEKVGEVKGKAGQAVEWTAEQCAELKEKAEQATDWTVEQCVQLKEKGSKLKKKAGEAFSILRAEEKGSASTGSDSDNSAVSTEIDKGNDIKMAPELTAEQNPLVEWLTSDQAKLYGKGALALLTIGGITYVLFKNRVPQRITRSVTKTPLRAVLTTACLIGIAAGAAHYSGVTLDGLNSFFVPSISS